jgi:uncharacterized membrane protein HdeD (DUF308 family)/alpha-beta hydrolase superfamily lysophospholipase
VTHRPLLIVLGVACAAFGAFAVLRPFASLRVLVAVVVAGMLLSAITAIAASRRASSRWPALLGGSAWLVAAVVVVAWPHVTTRVLAFVVGVALIVDGILDALAGIRGGTDRRAAAVIGGAASVVFGILALVWPDVTVLVVTVVFGARLVLFGLRLAWSAWRQSSSSLRPSTHLVGAVAALVVALALAGVSVRINGAEPVVDAFYDTPDDMPAEPGALLRQEEFTRRIPDGARAWRILYTTTRADGVPALASGIVVVPAEVGAEPPPVIAWAHGTTGVARRCAPSLLPDPWAAGALFVLDRVLEQGWALVATDYIGLGSEGGHPYLVGQPAGRSVLDAVRAARQLEDLDLAEETVVWGHSQGGGAALWTGIIAPDYAPDVDVVGVAALAPASDLVALMDTLGHMTGGSVFASYALAGYANSYADVAVSEYVRPAARTTFEETVDRCLNASALASILSSVAVGMDMFNGDLSSGPLVARLEENLPAAAIVAPLLLAQGSTDGLIVPDVQSDYVAERCAAGYDVDYRTYPGLGHVPLVETGSPLIPELFAWTADRFAGAEPAPASCHLTQQMRGAERIQSGVTGRRVG